MWHLYVDNVGSQGRRQVMVYEGGIKRPALFDTRDDALEAARVIEIMRTDSAFLRVECVSVD